MDILDLQNKTDYTAWVSLLQKSGLHPEHTVEEVYGIYDRGQLIATGSLFHNIIKCIAIEPAFHGGNVFHDLLSGLITQLYQKGFDTFFLYTKPQAAKSFPYLGFQEVERVPEKLVFMEKSRHGLESYLQRLQEETKKARKSELSCGHLGAIIMNANPFTLGHRYLIEQALQHCNTLHLFVVREDASEFSYAVRRMLVEEGTRDLSGIILHDTDSYLVSAATFPSYFLTENENVTRIHATLDARIFKYHVAPALKISMRFVGDEPLSPATALYNQAMQEVFATTPPPNFPMLKVFPRMEKEGKVISASAVRQLLAEGCVEDALALVPESTRKYLMEEYQKKSQ